MMLIGSAAAIVLPAYSLIGTTSAQACSTSTPASAVLTATALALNEYSYCGLYINVVVPPDATDPNQVEL